MDMCHSGFPRILSTLQMVCVRQHPYRGISRTTDTRSIVDAAKCSSIVPPLPLVNTVDGFVADVPDAKILLSRRKNKAPYRRIARAHRVPVK